MAGPSTDSTGQIQKSKKQDETPLVDLLARMSPEMAKALPRHVTPERMARVVLTAIRNVPELALCTAASFASSVMQASQLGLEPNTPLGHCYLLPYKSKHLENQNLRVCQLIIGYKGYIELARRAGAVVFAYAVHDGDDFGYKLGLTPDIHHVPSEDPKRETWPITHSYAVAVHGTQRVFVVLTRAKIEERRARSRASKSGPWVTDYEDMCNKTAVRALAKWMPTSPELMMAQSIDPDDTSAPALPVFDPVVTAALAAHGLEPEPEDAELLPSSTSSMPVDFGTAKQESFGK